MKTRVLLVDDMADLRFLLRVALETDGAFEVVGEAGDGEAAVELAARTTPDVIVLDLSMPTMDGLEALPRLRQAVPGATIAVLSGFQGTRLAASATELGADAYFEKGSPPSAILEGLKETLGLTDAAVEDDAQRVTVLAGAELHAVVAHDLQSPLSAVIGFGETLELRWDQLDDDLRRTLVRRMTAQARVLQAVASNLLAAESVDLGTVEVNLLPAAPASLVTDLADSLRPLCGEHPLDVQVEPDLPVVLVDRLRLLQILVNLVTNAEHHAPPGTPIGLRARSDGAWVAIEVADRGPGIPHEDRVRVFEKHVRLAHEAKGLGLGLFVASTYAKAMGGSVAIADNDGGGTRVVCRLRLADGAS